MPMFEELFALASGATLTLIVSADATSERMTVSVVPKPKDDSDEVALRQPLSLTATPQEFDTGFLTVLRDYREARAGLAEQAAATKEVIEAARSASAKKAGDAASKANRPAVPSPQAARTAAQSDARAAEANGASVAPAGDPTPQSDDLFG